jgi:hypothetical protein
MHPLVASWPPAQQGLARRLHRVSWFTFVPSHRSLRSMCGLYSGERSRVSVPGAALGAGRQGRPGARLLCRVCAAGRGCNELVQAAGLSLAWHSTEVQEEAAKGSNRRPSPTTAHVDLSSCDRAGNRDWQKGRSGRAAGLQSSFHGCVQWEEGSPAQQQTAAIPLRSGLPAAGAPCPSCPASQTALQEAGVHLHPLRIFLFLLTPAKHASDTCTSKTHH